MYVIIRNNSEDKASTWITLSLVISGYIQIYFILSQNQKSSAKIKISYAFLELFFRNMLWNLLVYMFCIRLQELQQRIQRVKDVWGDDGSQPSETLYKEEMGKIRKDIVDFHGEMVLLENYSNINYTGI